jgi:hypothetical protein
MKGIIRQLQEKKMQNDKKIKKYKEITSKMSIWKLVTTQTITRKICKMTTKPKQREKIWGELTRPQWNGHYKIRVLCT